MSQHELRHLAHQAMSLLPSPWLRYHNGRHAIRDGIAFNFQDPPGPSFNYAAVLGVVQPLDHVVKLADEFFANKEGGYGVLVEGDVDHPLEAELLARGWTVFEDEPAMVRPTLDDITSESATKPDFVVRIAREEPALKVFGDLLGQAFGSPPEMTSALTPSVEYASDPDIAVLVGYKGTVPVTAGQLLRIGRIANIGGVGTISAERGRGYGAALTMAALLEGRRRGCTAGALRSGPLSMPLYQRLGFQVVCQHRTYVPPATRRE